VHQRIAQLVAPFRGTEISIASPLQPPAIVGRAMSAGIGPWTPLRWSGFDGYVSPVSIRASCRSPWRGARPRLDVALFATPTGTTIQGRVGYPRTARTVMAVLYVVLLLIAGALGVPAALGSEGARIGIQGVAIALMVCGVDLLVVGDQQRTLTRLAYGIGDVSPT
jgi:hypothetical protein